MCGIFAILGSSEPEQTLRAQALALSKLLRHRGPDWNGIHMQKASDGTTNVLCHERLAIVDPESGKQPLFDATGKVVVTVNGEIYNHMELRKKLSSEVVAGFRTQSDCEVISHLWIKYGREMVQMLDGMFAFVISDGRTGEVFAARDAIGICPLYMGWSGDGSVVFASEMKALTETCPRFAAFEPGSYYSSVTQKVERWFQPTWWNDQFMPSEPLDLVRLRTSFEQAVEKRLMSDVPFGVLLSGGLDSSLVASICAKYLERRKDELESSSRMVFSRLHSFSIGLPGSPDLVAAKKVADHLGTVHHAFTFTVEEGIDAISDVIYHLETYDVTTIRASTPMYFLSRKIKAMGVKMVLSGEGADEIFGGYLYFHKCPNKKELHEETLRKIKILHKYDVLRANKSTSAWGLEVRVPFLDKAFLEVAMMMDPQEKLVVKGERIEKWAMRKAFDGTGMLPDDVLWRQKEQFSDGVGYSWIDGLKDHADRTVSDARLQSAHLVFPHNTPTTKEAYLYRSIFAKHFPQQAALETVPGGPSIACSTAAAIAWDASFRNNADASGRAVIDVHTDGRMFSDAQDGARLQSPSRKRVKVAH